MWPNVDMTHSLHYKWLTCKVFRASLLPWIFSLYYSRLWKAIWNDSSFWSKNIHSIMCFWQWLGISVCLIASNLKVMHSFFCNIFEWWTSVQLHFNAWVFSHYCFSDVTKLESHQAVCSTSSLFSQHSFIRVPIHILRKRYLRHYCKPVIWKSSVKKQLQKNTRIHPRMPSTIQMEDIQIPNIKTVVQIRRPVKLVKLEQQKIFRGDRCNVGKCFTEESGD